MKKVLFVGCVKVGHNIFEALVAHPDILLETLTLTKKQAKEHKVSGFLDFQPLCKKHGIPCYFPKSFNLKNQADLEFFKNNSYDLMIVGGWQRLIPAEVLKTISIAAIGIHGSGKKLPHGRGRSPVNWALIEGATQYYVHVFILDPDVDSGPIVDVMEFEITPFDTCDTIYKKISVASKRIIEKNLGPLLNGNAQLISQKGEATFYPKRTPEDGKLDFNQKTEVIYNLIRAVTKPYPGAFCYINGKKLSIWRAIPFGKKLSFPSFRPGQICEVFEDGAFVVKTQNDALLVMQYEPHCLVLQRGAQLA
tara:strand:+ start:2653 stop:3573 length:921 start_codon:yes stop_codon:yes gene_type:complete